MRRILISGASVAGPALALWLSRYGFEVTVVERSPELRPGGYAVDFRGTAMQVLERMGLIEAIRKYETRTGSILMVNEKGKTLARLPDGFTSGELEILRGDLAEVLYKATCDEARYIFGDSIRELKQNDQEVEVTFASGERESFDLVVGADGLHSNVRALAFGAEERFVRHMGYYIAIFTIPDYLGLRDAGRYYLERGRRVGYFAMPNDGDAKASFYFASKKLDYGRGAADQQKALLRDTFAGMKWETRRLLDLLDVAPDFYFDSLSQVKMESWTKGRVALLGDAASCASPMSGMGTSLAVVGAYILARELKNASHNYAGAFHKYETTMRAFAEEAQKMAEGVSWFIPETRLKLWLSNTMWSWMPKSTLRKLMVGQPAQIATMVKLT